MALPFTTKLFLIVVLPALVLPILMLDASPPKLIVLAVVFAKLNVEVLTVKLPPSMLTLPSTSKLLRTLVLPVAAPILTVVPAPAKLTVVAVVFNKLNVV